MVDVPKLCPNDNAPLRLVKGPKGDFYGCTNYPACRFTENVPSATAPVEAKTAPVATRPSSSSQQTKPDVRTILTDILIELRQLNANVHSLQSSPTQPERDAIPIIDEGEALPGDEDDPFGI